MKETVYRRHLHAKKSLVHAKESLVHAIRPPIHVKNFGNHGRPASQFSEKYRKKERGDRNHKP
jgi:hypothetical protein